MSSETNGNRLTTISVRKKTKNRLKDYKLVSRESDESVLTRILDDYEFLKRDQNGE